MSQGTDIDGLPPVAGAARDRPVPRDIKTIGRRVERPLAVDEAFALQQTIVDLYPGGICERGVFRFRTFEEAEAWLMQQAVSRARAHRRARTSSD